MNGHTSIRHVGIGIALLSIALLMTELILTRLFSVTIFYHFAFLAISLALFGFGTAALLLHLNQHRLVKQYTDVLLSLSSIVLGITILFSNIILINIAPDISPGFLAESTVSSASTAIELILIFVVGAMPFFVGGFAISLAITRYSNFIHSLYFFDLLGAGLGCLLVIPLLNSMGAPLALAIVAALASLAGISFTFSITSRIRSKLRWASSLVAVSILMLAAFNPSLGLFEIHHAKGQDFNTFEVEFNRWNSFSMVSVLKTGGFRGWGTSPTYNGSLPNHKSLVIDLGAFTPLINFDGDFSGVSHILYDLSAFVYNIKTGDTGEVCVIGAGGGRDVIAALASGKQHVTAVEINPIIVQDIVCGEYQDFTGGIYNRSDVTVVIDDGRAFLRGSENLFDIIQLSMVDTSAATAAGAYSLTENNLYTVEAFEDYLAHLRPGGMLSVSHVSVPTLAGGARLCSIAWQSLRNLGMDPSKSIAVIGTPWINLPNATMYNVIVKRGVFTTSELMSIRNTAERLAFSLVYPSGKEITSDNWIGSILETEDEHSLRSLIASWPLDVSPAVDDQPFFFYQNRLVDLMDLQALFTLSLSFGKGLLILTQVAIISLAMVTLFLIIPILFSHKDVSTGQGQAIWDISYVACLGLGFMCIEIGMMQKFSLYLGFPTYTLSVVLFVLLTAGATGSYLFGRVPPANRQKQLFIIFCTLVGLLVVVWQCGLVDTLLNNTVGLPSAGRSVIVAVLLMPVGLLLGIPLPAGLSAVAARTSTRIPWLWAINSATSVLGSVVAILVSIHAGIATTLWVGVILYVLALFLSLKVTVKAPRS